MIISIAPHSTFQEDEMTGGIFLVFCDCLGRKRLISVKKTSGLFEGLASFLREIMSLGVRVRAAVCENYDWIVKVVRSALLEEPVLRSDIYSQIREKAGGIVQRSEKFLKTPAASADVQKGVEDCAEPKVRMVEIHQEKIDKPLYATKEVVPSGISLRTEIFKEFENMKHSTKMPQNGVIDFLGTRMTLIFSEVFPLLFRILIDKFDYEEGYNLVRSLGKEMAHLITSRLRNKFKITGMKDAVPFYTRLATLIRLGELFVKEYNAEKGVIRIRILNSPLCAYFKNMGKETGAFMEGIMEGGPEVYLGPTVNCKEVKCVSKGDEYCEYLLTFSTRKTSSTKIKPKNPKSCTPQTLATIQSLY